MIVKENLSPRRVVEYTARPMAWAAAWAVVAPALLVLTGWTWLALPFAPVAAVGAALAIFIAFRNNTAFNRWNEARISWQTVQVACRVLARNLVASGNNAVAAGLVDQATADRVVQEDVRRLIAIAVLLVGRVRETTDWERVAGLVGEAELRQVRDAHNPPNVLLTIMAVRIKDGIRGQVFGQFDPITLEPQLAALNTAQGVMERIRFTPTPRQYRYFTRRFVELFALLAPFGLLSVFPQVPWLVIPVSLVLAGVFIVMEVTGSANDEPFSCTVTDIPVLAVVQEIERDLLEQLGETALPPAPVPVNGYLW